MELISPISEINYIAKKLSRRLEKLGLKTVRDLIFYYPFRYEDLSKITPISDLEPGQTATIKGQIEIIENKRALKRRMFITHALISDGKNKIKAIWFNQPFLTKVLKPGQNLYLSGKVDTDRAGLILSSPIYEKISRLRQGSGGQAKETVHTARIVPIYPLGQNITQKQLRYVIKSALPALEQIKDWIPADIIKKEKLIKIARALTEIHFPTSFNKLEQAKDRLKFNELFLYQLQGQLIKQEIGKHKAPMIKFFEKQTKEFVSSLPFELTNAQKKSAWEILNDIQNSKPMNRLLEGDVGSGKTVVCAIAIYNCALNNCQSVLMAPTEILARQHFETLKKLFKNTNIKLALYTRGYKEFVGNHPEPEKKISKLKAISYKLEAANIVIGTHALIQQDTQFSNIGLIIIDEQHRFGVEQRKKLKDKTPRETPHFLSTTATPIPRSLSLTLYGELDLSIINQLPKSRKKIITKIVSPRNRQKAYRFIDEQINKGHQIFVICPLIDPSDMLGVKSVTEEHEKLSAEIFPHRKIGLLHGKLKSKEKEQVMDGFKNNKINVLVSTSVVEVGVDIPNATVMMIEGADRFGLAQLHQFRGRVGRSDLQSYCFLFTESRGQKTAERLKALEKSNNGFELAQKDLEIRGPGEMYGLSQSGFPELKIATIFDFDISKRAKNQAEKIIDKLDKHPLLLQKLKSVTDKVHLE